MSTSNEQNRNRMQANQVTVEILRVDGTHETAVVDRVKWLKQIEQLIGADSLDSVDLRDGRAMFAHQREVGKYQFWRSAGVACMGGLYWRNHKQCTAPATRSKAGNFGRVNAG